MTHIRPNGKDFVSKHLVERIVIDSDFDGVVCGAMLRVIFPKAEILQSKASDIQQGKFDHLLNSKTLLADLRYSPLCGYFFDHHESNLPSEKFIGYWSPEPSAAQVIFSYFRDIKGIDRFIELIDDVNKIDSGNISLDEFINPNKIVQLSLLINRADKFFNLWLVEILTKFSIDKIYEHPFIQERIRDYVSKMKLTTEYIISNSYSKDDVTVVDIANYSITKKIHGFVYTSIFLDSKVVVVMGKPIQDEGTIPIKFYKNNFYKGKVKVDLLNVAQKLNPKTAGGHPSACGVIVEKGKLDRKNILGLVKSELNKF